MMNGMADLRHWANKRSIGSVALTSEPTSPKTVQGKFATGKRPLKATVTNFQENGNPDGIP